MTYGFGSLGKDVVNGKNLDTNSAWKSGVAGTVGGAAGKGIAWSAGRVRLAISDTTRTGIEAFTGSGGSTLIYNYLNGVGQSYNFNNANQGNKK